MQGFIPLAAQYLVAATLFLASQYELNDYMGERLRGWVIFAAYCFLIGYEVRYMLSL